jgi:xanthine dehydrogenase molybdopterin-binding subunit B
MTAAGHSTFHESARAQVAGAATYVDDIPEIKEGLAEFRKPAELTAT